jgi:hypothetical protein
MIFSNIKLFNCTTHSPAITVLQKKAGVSEIHSCVRNRRTLRYFFLHHLIGLPLNKACAAKTQIFIKGTVYNEH